jgi:spore maturation protein CgeB
MRILMVHPLPGPDFSVHDVFTGWLEAFHELGVQVAIHNTNDRLVFFSRALLPEIDPATGKEARDESGLRIVRQAVSQEQAITMAMEGLTHSLYTFGPDVVMFVSAFFTTEKMFKLIRAHGHKIVILHTESPYQDDEQMMRGQLAHLNLLNDPANLSQFRALGMPAEYQPHCYRPSVHYPRSGPLTSELASDFVFVGTAFESRIRFFEALDLAGIDTMIMGNEWGKLPETSPLAPYIATGAGNEADCVTNPEAAELYRNARIGLNYYRREGESAHENDVAVAMGPREVEMAACQLAFLRDSRPEGDQVLSMLPRFDGPGDASGKLRYYLGKDRIRERCASLAREAVEDRTFVNSARRLLATLDKLS